MPTFGSSKVKVKDIAIFFRQFSVMIDAGLPLVQCLEILAANQVFHRRLSEMAGNQRVLGQLNLTLGYVARLDTLCTQTVPGWIGHADILRAIERHEPAEARLAMQVHVDASRDKMIKLFSA